MSDEKNHLIYKPELSYQSIFRYCHSVEWLHGFPFHMDEEEQNAPYNPLFE